MRTRPLHKGTIFALLRETKSGVSMLAIEDERQGKILIPCYGKETAKQFDEAFGGVLVLGRFNNDAIAGEPIYYRLNELGILCEFCPINERTPPELVEEYASGKPKATAAPETRKDPYGGSGTCTNLGSLPPDDPVYSKGPIVAGREIGKPHRPYTAEDRERNFQVARDAIAKAYKNPTENN